MTTIETILVDDLDCNEAMDQVQKQRNQMDDLRESYLLILANGEFRHCGQSYSIDAVTLRIVTRFLHGKMERWGQYQLGIRELSDASLDIIIHKLQTTSLLS
jgi:hypothetical protein